MKDKSKVSSQDEEFMICFENCTLPPESFHHREHIKMSWLYLRRYEPIEALARVSEGIRRFATFHGKAERYHETITWAYFFLIRERIERMGTKQTWEEFATRNEDLFNWNDSVLKLYYNETTLASDLARKTFLLPDRQERSR